MNPATPKAFLGGAGWLKVLAGILFLPFLFTCRPSVNSVQIVGIRNVQTRSLDASGTVVDIRVAIQNPNFAAVRITAIDLLLALDGTWIAKGTSRAPADLPGHGVGEVDVRLEVSWSRLSRSDMMAILSAEIPYKVEGTISLDKPLAISDIRISATGRYAVQGPFNVSIQPDLAASSLISLHGVKVSSVGLARQDGFVEVILDNPLTFEVPLSRMDYQIDAGGMTVARGSMPHLTVKQGKNKFQVPISVSTIEAGLGALGSLLRGSLPELTARGALVLGEPGRERTLEWECKPE